MTIKQISVSEVAALLSLKDVVIVDIRDARSFSLGHLPDAAHVTNNNMRQFVLSLSETQAILVYGYSGEASSRITAQFFVDSGFRDVYCLEGGYAAWQAARASAEEAV